MFEDTVRSAPNWPPALGGLGYFYGTTNRAAEAEKILTRLDQLARDRYVPPWARAIVYVGLGRKDRALDWLEKGCEEHDGWMWTISGDAWFDTLRGEPRFKALVKRVGPRNENVR